jgi:hypothetical protein
MTAIVDDVADINSKMREIMTREKRFDPVPAMPVKATSSPALGLGKPFVDPSSAYPDYGPGSGPIIPDDVELTPGCAGGYFG